MNDMKLDYVCHDDLPYVTAGIDDAYYVPKKMGKFKPTKRTEGISTTDVVARILRNKEMYYVRNMRRGVSRDKLGMSFFRYCKLKVEMMLCPSRFDHPKAE